MEKRKSSTFNFHCFTVFKDIPSDLIKTFTVDRGKEFARYVDIENTLNIDVYFADVYAFVKEVHTVEVESVLEVFKKYSDLKKKNI